MTYSTAENVGEGYEVKEVMLVVHKFTKNGDSG